MQTHMRRWMSMPIRLYKEDDIVIINDLDDPCCFVCRIAAGELQIEPGMESWLEMYPPNLLLCLYPIVMTMPEKFWIAVGQFEDERKNRNDWT